MSSSLSPFYTKKSNQVIAPSPLQTSFSLFSPVSPLQPKFDNFDIKNENYDEILQYNVLNFFKKKVRKDDLVVFNTYPYKVSEDLKKIFNDDNFLKNRGNLSLSNNVSILKEVISKINLLNDVSKCIVEPDWDIFQKAASIIQANWRGYCKRKEFINNYLENASNMKNIKFVKNYTYFNKKEPKYITKVELYSKLDFLTRHKKTSNLQKSPTSEKNIKSLATTPYNNKNVLAKYGGNGDNADRFANAAIKIQSDFRGYYVRHYYKKYQNSNLQATKIQALWRGYITRKKYEFNVTMNSLNKLCQQNTFLIENLYKLINPFITSDNKLNLSLYEEKINNLSKQFNKLTQDNAKQAAEYEKNIERMVKDRQRDKEEYTKQIKELKNNMEDMKREVYSIKKELNLPPLARSKNAAARASIFENTTNGPNGNNNNNYADNNNNNNYGNNNSNLINKNGSNPSSNRSSISDNSGGISIHSGSTSNNSNSINNNNSNSGSSSKSGNTRRSSIIEKTIIDNYFSRDTVNSNFMMKKNLINKIIYYKNNCHNSGAEITDSNSSLPGNANPSLPMNNTNIASNNDNYSNMNNSNIENDNNGNNKNAMAPHDPNNGMVKSNQSSGHSHPVQRANSSRGKNYEEFKNKSNNSNNISNNGNNNSNTINNNSNTGNNNNYDIDGNRNNNKIYMEPQDSCGMGRSNPPPDHPQPIQRANSNHSKNYEEFKSNWMNNEKSSSLLDQFPGNNGNNGSNTNISNSNDINAANNINRNNPNANTVKPSKSELPSRSNTITRSNTISRKNNGNGKSKNPNELPPPLSLTSTTNGNGANNNNKMKSPTTKTSEGQPPLSPQHSNRPHSSPVSSSFNNMSSNSSISKAAAQQNIPPNNKLNNGVPNSSPSSGMNNDSNKPSRNKVGKLNTSPNTLNSGHGSNSTLSSPNSNNKMARLSISPQTPSSPNKIQRFDSPPNHLCKSQSPSNKPNSNFNSNTNGSVSPTSGENKSISRSNTMPKSTGDSKALSRSNTMPKSQGDNKGRSRSNTTTKPSSTSGENKSSLSRSNTTKSTSKNNNTVDQRTEKNPYNNSNGVKLPQRQKQGNHKNKI